MIQNFLYFIDCKFKIWFNNAHYQFGQIIDDLSKKV